MYISRDVYIILLYMFLVLLIVIIVVVCVNDIIFVCVFRFCKLYRNIFWLNFEEI